MPSASLSVRLIISLHPQYLSELRSKQNHTAMHTASSIGAASGSGIAGVGDSAPAAAASAASYYNGLASLLWTGRAAARTLDNFTRLGLKRAAAPAASAALGFTSQTNHFPSFDELCNKAPLSRRLKFYSKLLPDEFDFVPQTWILPQEWESLRAEVVAKNGAAASVAQSSGAAATPAASSASAAAAKPTTYIFKPSTGSQGAGISLAQRLQDVEAIVRRATELGSGGPTGLGPGGGSSSSGGMSMTVQEYIGAPLLLNGLKFDFRIYVLLESLEPLRFHLYRDGLARFCTESYTEPSGANLRKAFMHLTNSSLNKSNAEKFNVKLTEELSAQERAMLNSELIEGSQAIENRQQQQSQQESKENPSQSAIRSPSPPSASSSSSPPASSSSFGADLMDHDSSKRSIRTVLSQLRAEGHALSDSAFWAGIARIVSRTLAAMWTGAYANYKIAFPSSGALGSAPAAEGHQGSACMHILGFDILLDSALKPWLLELNCSPSLNVDSTLDLVLKKGMMEKSLAILGYLGEENRRKKRKDAAMTVERRASPSPTNDSNAAAATSAVPVSEAPSNCSDTASASRFPSITIFVDASPASVLPVSRERSTSSSVCSATGSPIPLSGIGGVYSAASSLPSSGTSTPLLPYISMQARRSVGGPPSTEGSARASPLTLPSTPSSAAGSSNAALQSPQPMLLPFVPVIPAFSKRRRTVSTGSFGGMLSSGGSSAASGPAPARFVVLPNGGVQALDAEGRVMNLAGNNTAAAVLPSAVAPPSTVPASAPEPPAPAPTLDEEQALVEFMEICPEEDFRSEYVGSSSYAAWVGLHSTPVHPLLLFQHPKLLAIFDKYTPLAATGGVKKMTSSKFMQACVACRIAAGTNPPPAQTAAAAAPSTTTPAVATVSTPKASAGPSTASNAASISSSASSAQPAAVVIAAPKPPLSNWPSRPDIDLLFLSHTKFSESGACSTSGSGSSGASMTTGCGGGPGIHPSTHGKFLDYSGFCDALFQIAETKYRHLIAPPTKTTAPPLSIAAALAGGCMTPAQAFLHFVDSLKMPEESALGSGVGSSASAATAAQQAGAMSSPTPKRIVNQRANATAAAASSRPESPAQLGPSSSHMRRSSASSLAGAPPAAAAASSPATPISRAALSATLTALLSPKDPSCSVFNRLQGVAAAPLSKQASSVKKRRKQALQEGSYEAFLAAHQASKLAAASGAKSKTGKK